MIEECTVKLRDEESYKRKKVEDSQKSSANAEQKYSNVPVKLHQGKHPKDNTPSIHQAHEILVQGDEWKQLKTKLRSKNRSLILHGKLRN